MTCAEVLETLSTASLRDMPADSAVMVHCATCPDCARVTTLLREKEYEAASVLNGLPPMSNPVALAEESVVTSKRRRVGRIAVIGTGAALVATIWIAASLTIFPEMIHTDSPPSELRTESMQLTCLSPQQAADLINPYVRSHGSNWYIPKSGISVITIRGTGDELAKSRDLIAQFETDPGAACKVRSGADINRTNDPMLTQALKDGIRGALAGEATSADPAKVADKVPTAPKK
ncbi:MAG TPA: hypothetical protein VGL17_05125 [Gemmatimonadaceae bacterium]